MVTLYRLFDDDLRLLYVGVAGNPGRRFEQHAADKPWWSDVAHVRTKHYQNRTAAIAAERVAIQEENPRYNIIGNKPRSSPHHKRDFELICTGCSQPGADYLEVDSGRASSNMRERQALDERRRAKAKAEGQPFVLISGAELLEEPDSVSWQAWHRTCDPHPNSDTYWIDAQQISRWEHVANWTAHLMGKNWFEYTDWESLLWGLSNHNGRLLRQAGGAA